MKNEKLKNAFAALYALEKQINKKQRIVIEWDKEKFTLEITDALIYAGNGQYHFDLDVESCGLSAICAKSKWMEDHFDFLDAVDMGVVSDAIEKTYKKELSALRKLWAPLVAQYPKRELNDLFDIYADLFSCKTFESLWKKFEAEVAKTEAKQQEEKNKVSFRLNNAYVAEFSPNSDTVKVGCQIFPKSVIKELASKL